LCAFARDKNVTSFNAARIVALLGFVVSIVHLVS